MFSMRGISGAPGSFVIEGSPRRPFLLCRKATCEQREQSQQSEQPGQPEQREQHEQPEQPEQREQSEQREQPEPSAQPSQS